MTIDGDKWNPIPQRLKRQQLKGFTLIELLVVIAIIALLVSILLPSLKKAKELAKDVKCMAHMRVCSTAMWLYSNEYDGLIPMQALRSDGVLVRWSQFLDGGSYLGAAYSVPGLYIEAKEALICPSAVPDNYQNPSFTYGSNFSPNSSSPVKAAIDNPNGFHRDSTSILDVTRLTSDYWMLVDSWNAAWSRQSYCAGEDPMRWPMFGGSHLRHSGSAANVLLGDGHVERMDQSGLYDVGFRSGYDPEQADACIPYLQ